MLVAKLRFFAIAIFRNPFYNPASAFISPWPLSHPYEKFNLTLISPLPLLHLKLPCFQMHCFQYIILCFQYTGYVSKRLLMFSISNPCFQMRVMFPNDNFSNVCFQYTWSHFCQSVVSWCSMVCVRCGSGVVNLRFEFDLV